MQFALILFRRTRFACAEQQCSSRSRPGCTAARAESPPCPAGPAQPQSLPILTALFLESVANHRHCAAKFTHTAEQLVMAACWPEDRPTAMLRLACTHRWPALCLHRDSHLRRCDCSPLSAAARLVARTHRRIVLPLCGGESLRSGKIARGVLRVLKQTLVQREYSQRAPCIEVARCSR